MPLFDRQPQLDVNQLAEAKGIKETFARSALIIRAQSHQFLLHAELFFISDATATQAMLKTPGFKDRRSPALASLARHSLACDARCAASAHSL